MPTELREKEDARRLTRERETLVVEQVRHVNQIRGLLATGVFVVEPIRKEEKLRRWDGEALPPRQKATLLRELDRGGQALGRAVALRGAQRFASGGGTESVSGPQAR